MIKRFVLAAAGVAVVAASTAVAKCDGRFSIEVLGSGGPIADDARASAGYLVWIDGAPRLLIDAGGGSFLRYAESGATLAALDGILISHFHADHVADIVAILKSGSFETRIKPLRIAGPAGGDHFPGLNEYLAGQFDPQRGVFRYLSGFLTGEGGRMQLDPLEVDASAARKTVIVDGDGLRAESIPVNHGDVPSLAYSVSTADATVIFAGDQSLFSEYFETTFEGAEPDLLIAHHAIAEAPGQPRGLHRSPSSIGEMAARLGAKRVLLSHNMTRALDDWKNGRRAIRAVYQGPVAVAHDNQCVRIVR